MDGRRALHWQRLLVRSRLVSNLLFYELVLETTHQVPLAR